MPTYQYACETCGMEFEVRQSMKDSPLSTCTCGKAGKVRRLISGGAGIIFKGSGFYETDYKRKGTAEPKAETAPTAPAKTESKPASPPPVSGTTP